MTNSLVVDMWITPEGYPHSHNLYYYHYLLGDQKTTTHMRTFLMS